MGFQVCMAICRSHIRVGPGVVVARGQILQGTQQIRGSRCCK